MKKRSNKNNSGPYYKPVDVRPLNQRESKPDTRKGMAKVQDTVNITWLEREQLLFDDKPLL